jgi:DNA-binding transcriptional regulator YhcF (GntR family)
MNSSAQQRDPAGSRLSEDISNRIARGELLAGQALMPVRQLAASHGISMRAALKALDRLADEGWVVRRHGSGVFVRDTTLPLARYRIQVEQRDDGFRGATFNQVRNALRAEPEFDLSDGGDDCGEFDCRLLLGGGASAAGERMPAVIVLPELALPELSLPPTEPSGYTDTVDVDYRRGAYAAGVYARSIGITCPVVAHAYADADDQFADIERLRAFALGFGQPLSQLPSLQCRAHLPAYGAAAVPELLARRSADFVFATTDDLAIGICHGLLAHGEQPGARIRIMGMDGQPAGRNESFELTSMALAQEQIAAAAVAALRRRCRKPNTAEQVTLVGMDLFTGSTA